MKAKYNKEIIQFSINGEQLNTFKNKNDASLKTSIHKDSIISCCLGKYKTSGGYIFKFKDNQENIDNKKFDIICKICQSKETIRSMAMHLKWVHNINTNEYVEKYDEYRPKNIKENKRLQESNIKCGECGISLKSNQHLMYHITKIHPNITQHDYIIENMYNNNPPLCKCGCGCEVTLLRNGKNCDLNKEKYNRDYIKGHWDWDVFTNNDNQSKEEKEILEYIKSIYTGNIETSTRSIIHKRELDIFLPELNIAIEYNGLYWHCEKNNTSRMYHRDKTDKCKSLGIRLIHIFADEWYNKKEIVKLKIKNILKCNNGIKIYARKCEIKEIKPELKDKFLEQYHIQGKDKSKIKLGLFYNDELVSVMTFSNPRIALGGNASQKSKYELSRFATSYQVLGGASKLLKYFIRKFNPLEIFSYSDNRWTDWDNNMYLTLGFNRTIISKPGYWYTKNFTSRIHRYNFRKQKLKKEGYNVTKTEKEIMESRGYFRIWDCGTTKYELNILT